MTDYEHRKRMWVFLSGLFEDRSWDSGFIWMFSENDMAEANRLPDGMGNLNCAGVVRGVTHGD